MLPLLNVQDIESLISSATGPVSYLAEWGSKTTMGWKPNQGAVRR